MDALGSGHGRRLVRQLVLGHAGQRPAAGRLGRSERGQPSGPRPAVLRRALPAQRPERREGVVGDLAGPDEVPQRVEDLAVRPPAGGGVQLAVERRPAPLQVGADPLVDLGRRTLHAVGQPDRPQELAARSIEHHPAVVAPEAPAPHPGDLAHRAQLVQQPRLVARDARREHVTLEDRRRDRQARQLVDDLGQALQGVRSAQRHRRRGAGGRRPGDALPGRQEPGQRHGIDRLDLLAQLRERPPPEQAQDLLIAVLALRAARPELAREEAARGDQAMERVLDHARREAPAPGGLGAEERAVGPRVPGEQPVERGDRRAEERLRDARAARPPRRRRGSGRRPPSRSSAPRRRSAPGPRAATPPAPRGAATPRAARRPSGRRPRRS